jgi:hypothetical protein
MHLLSSEVLEICLLLLLDIMAFFLEQELSVFQSCVYSIMNMWDILVRRWVWYLGAKDLFEEPFHSSNCLLCGRPSRKAAVSLDCI